MHDIVIVGIPLVAILAGILFNRNDSKELRSDLADFRAEVLAKFSAIDSDLRQFYHVTGKLEGRLDEIAKR